MSRVSRERKVQVLESFERFCCVKTKVIHKYLGIVMQIGLVVLWIGDPHPDIVFPLEGMLSLGRARNKLLLPGPVQRLNIDLWPWLHVNLCGSNNYFKN